MSIGVRKDKSQQHADQIPSILAKKAYKSGWNLFPGHAMFSRPLNFYNHLPMGILYCLMKFSLTPSELLAFLLLPNECSTAYFTVLTYEPFGAHVLSLPLYMVNKFYHPLTLENTCYLHGNLLAAICSHVLGSKT